jgi:hypothetical protein
VFLAHQRRVEVRFRRADLLLAVGRVAPGRVLDGRDEILRVGTLACALLGSKEWSGNDRMRLATAGKAVEASGGAREAFSVGASSEVAIEFGACRLL